MCRIPVRAVRNSSRTFGQHHGYRINRDFAVYTGGSIWQRGGNQNDFLLGSLGSHPQPIGYFFSPPSLMNKLSSINPHPNCIKECHLTSPRTWVILLINAPNLMAL